MNAIAHDLSPEHAIAAEVRYLLSLVGAARMITLSQSIERDGSHDDVDDLLSQVIRAGDELVDALTTPTTLHAIA